MKTQFVISVTLPLLVRSRWTDERRQNRVEAEWIVSWLRDNSPATVREIIEALNHNNRDVKPHVIRRALFKSQFVEISGDIQIDGERHTLWSFSGD